MTKYDDVCLEIQIILDDIQIKAEEKKEFEIRATRLGLEIKTLKGKVVDIIQSKLDVKQTK